ncbi:hypothetical protein JVT61DRAFT_1137 [Boletus reticuloceps]|uniref:F-box domain-containing protein n=1 Tax=Boletus reticuloceps TaxID=495285 RepID=A0A8I3A9Q7_9AGAM|nr:hypothetical protein JVT61DRAFT_1137 [Boletus reticuloceps]
MQCPSVSRPVRDDGILPPHRYTSKIPDVPTFASRPSSALSSASSSPSSPPPPYEDVHFVSKPIFVSPLSGSIESPSLPRSGPPDSGLAMSCNSQASISHLRDALSSLDTQMASLLSQRQELELHLEQAVHSQSPIYRLPEELLSSIFVIGVCQSGDQDSLLVSSLMLVSRYWRDVVVNTPELWATICISPHDSLQKARRKLARSKSVPLDITVNFSPRTDNATSVMESIIRAMDLVRPALWRARSFRLSVPNKPQAHAALIRCKEDAPLLETLSICIFHSMQEDHCASPCLPLFNGHIPRLRSCSFTSFNFSWDKRMVSGLRVLQLGGYWNGFSPSVDKLLEMLRGCPQLEELALRNMSDTDPEATAHPEPEFMFNKVVKLPRLVKASFYYAGNMRVRMLLSQISFPALESLEFCYLDNLTRILEYLRQQSLTSLPLRHLRIESSFFNESKFVTLLKRLMSLTTLELIDIEDVSGFLLKSLSTPPNSHPWICPKLEHLSLDGCTSLEWDSLRSFVESRLSGKSPQLPSSPMTAMRGVSSASASAHIHALAAGRCSSLPAPRRLTSIDITHCHQINKEMVQWLRMYVPDVCCDPAKGVWGEAVLP